MMNFKVLEKQKGITIIALVITIVVLIILAGIVVNATIGSNGIITKAKQAKQETRISQIKENIALEILNEQIEKGSENISDEKLEEIISKYGKLEDDKDTITTNEGYKISLKEIYSGTISEDIGNNTDLVNSLKNRILSLEKEIIDGKKEIAEAITNKGVETSKDDTFLIMAKNISLITGSSTSPTAGGSYDNPYIPTGFKHIGTEGWNSGYRISDTGDETGNIFVWVPCVLDQSKVKEGDKVETFKKTTTGKYNSYSLGLASTDASITDVEPTNAIKESVGKYGGFYIAAYEAGIEGTKDNNSLSTKTETNGSIKPLSKAGYGVWNYITRANALTVATSMINTEDGVRSGLISGECWDTTLQWMVNSSTNATSNAGYDTDSIGKGWYNDVSSNEIRTTGYYAVNNIYDMGGNVWEYTAESGKYNESKYLIFRGGAYSNLGSDRSAAYRSFNSSNGTAKNDIGFRVVLYK